MRVKVTAIGSPSCNWGDAAVDELVARDGAW